MADEAAEAKAGERTVDVTLPMRISDGVEMRFKMADAMATFVHEGVEGEIAWCLPGGPVQVVLREGERVVNFSLSINDIAQTALRLYREAHPKASAAAEGVQG